MKSDKLNRYVSVWRPVTERDSIGGTQTNMSKSFSDWANIKPLDGAEILRYGIIDEIGTSEIYIRFRRDVSIDATCEIHYDSNEDNKVYSIRSVVNENGDDTFFKILAVEKR